MGAQNVDNVPTSPQIDPPHRSNGSNTRQTPQTAVRVPAGRSRLAERIERVLNGALAGEPAVITNISAGDLLGESAPVARVIAAALARPGSGLAAHWRVTEAFRHSGLTEKIFDSLASGDPMVRAAASRLCGAMRLTESVPW